MWFVVKERESPQYKWCLAWTSNAYLMVFGCYNGHKVKHPYSDSTLGPEIKADRKIYHKTFPFSRVIFEALIKMWHNRKVWITHYSTPVCGLSDRTIHKELGLGYLLIILSGFCLWPHDLGECVVDLDKLWIIIIILWSCTLDKRTTPHSNLSYYHSSSFHS